VILCNLCSVAAQITSEQEALQPQQWLQSVAWPRSLAPSLQTFAMGAPRTVLVRRPVADAALFLSTGQWEVAEEPSPEATAAASGTAAAGDDSTYGVGTLDKPTAKLSQYARGKTGAMKPFAPGGIHDDTAVSSTSGSKDATAAATSAKEATAGGSRIAVKLARDATHTSEAAIAASLLALRDDWQTDMSVLITAPPGVAFTCGLSRADVECPTAVPVDAGNIIRMLYSNHMYLIKFTCVIR
jgi:hypothetical protein